MDYLLAKKLKEKGFPLKLDSYEAFAHIDEFKYQIPTLSELIEACGEKFWELQANPTTEGKWLSRGSIGEGKYVYSKFGETPEIAVANLWLKLREVNEL